MTEVKEEVGKWTGKSTPYSVALSGAAVPSASMGDWQLLCVLPVGRTDCGGVRKMVSAEELQR